MYSSSIKFLLIIKKKTIQNDEINQTIHDKNNKNNNIRLKFWMIKLKDTLNTNETRPI